MSVVGQPFLRVTVEVCVIDIAKKHNLPVGAQPRNLAQAQEWIEMGFNVISYTNDLNIYIDGLSEAVANVRKLPQVG